MNPRKRNSRNLFSSIKKYFLLVSVLLATTTPNLLCKANWTMLIYAQAKNSLAQFAYKNFYDMAQIGSNKNLNILVQWYQPKQSGTWRYKVEKGKLVLKENITTPSDGTNVKDLVDAMQWAVKNYPAHKYSLVLWNHGIGILDPVWGESSLMISPKIVNNNPRIQLAGITMPETGMTGTGTINTGHKRAPLKKRGVLFNEESKTYMNNQELLEALSQIKTKVLKNKKLDLLGMDTCLMAMVEVGYQVRNYAHYLVGSEEVELAYGWPYNPLVADLTAKNLTPLQFAQTIVKNYEDFYKNKINFYTQSAIDLKKINLIKPTLNHFVDTIRACKKIDKPGITKAVKKARKQCLQFSTRSYIDAYSFFEELSGQLSRTYDKKYTRLSYKLRTAITKLKKALTANMTVIKNIVVANTSGKYLSGAQGLSIYFPETTMSACYEKTLFAQDCSWTDFVEETLYE